MPGSRPSGRRQLRGGQRRPVLVARAARPGRPVRLHGRRRAAARTRLDGFFDGAERRPEPEHAFLSNEPNLGTPWLYDWLGRPDRAQSVVRRALLELYGPGPAGMPGNDDGGTMGAWWVFGALGMYPAVPGTDVLALGQPALPARRGAAAARNAADRGAPGGAGRPYVRSLALDGRTWRSRGCATAVSPAGPQLRFALGGKADLLGLRRAARRRSLRRAPSRTLDHGGAPPRRGSPPPLSSPVCAGRGATACTPPKKRLLLLPAAHRPAALLELVERAGVDPGLGVHLAALHVQPRRGRPPPRRGRPSSTTARIVWRIAERIRFEPAEPSASSGRPSRSTTVGAIMLGTRAPGRVPVEPERVQVLLAEHVVQVHAGAGHHHAGAGAVRAGDRWRSAPSASITDTCVVLPSRERTSRGHRVERLLGQEALEVALAAEPLEEVRVARPVGGGDHLGDHRRRRAGGRAARGCRARPRSGSRPTTAAGW